MAMQGMMMKKSIGFCKRVSLSKLRSFSSFSTSSAATTTDEIARKKLQLPPFDHEAQPYKGPLADEVLAKRKKFLGPSLFHYYQKPVSRSPKLTNLFSYDQLHYINSLSSLSLYPSL